MIKVITKEEILSKISPNLIATSRLQKVSHPNPEYPFLIEKEVLKILIFGSQIGTTSNNIMSLKMSDKLLPIRILPSDKHQFILNLTATIDELDDIHIEYKGEEREEKLNQIL